MGYLSTLTVVAALLSLHFTLIYGNSSTVTEITNGKVPLSKSVFANCPSSKQYVALQVSVDSNVAYYSCFDPIQKTPIFTVNEIHFTSEKDLSRPDVEPWYPYNNNRAYGNGKAIIGGYDRGHLSPSADFERTTTEMMQSTFHVFNRAAQVGSFNRNNWRRLESITRNWVQKIQSTCSTCSVKVLTGTTTKSIGVTREALGVTLPIPKYYYKIVMVFNGTKSYAVLFFGSNDIQQNRFPITVVGANADVAKIPTEIQQDLSNVLGLANLLYKNSNGLLRGTGRAMLLNQIPDAESRLQ